MPTGITAPIYEGEDISVRDYLLRCSRQMGANAHMRDESLDVKPRYRKTDYSYYTQRIEELKQDIIELQTTDVTELQKKYDEQYEQQLITYREVAEQRKELRLRFEAMREQVSEWMPPTEEHRYLKNFAIEQIDESIRWDCREITDEDVKRVVAEREREFEIESKESMIESYKRTIVETGERDEAHNAWIRELYASLPAE